MSNIRRSKIQSNESDDEEEFSLSSIYNSEESNSSQIASTSRGRNTNSRRVNPPPALPTEDKKKVPMKKSEDNKNSEKGKKSVKDSFLVEAQDISNIKPNENAPECQICCFPISVYAVFDCQHSHMFCASCILHIKMFNPTVAKSEDDRPLTVPIEKFTEETNKRGGSSRRGRSGRGSTRETNNSDVSSDETNPDSNSETQPNQENTTTDPLDMDYQLQCRSRHIKCPICHVPQSKLIFSTSDTLKHSQIAFPFTNAQDKLIPIAIPQLNVFTDTQNLANTLIRLTSLFCTNCDHHEERNRGKRVPTFNTLREYNAHTSVSHSLSFCTACVCANPSFVTQYRLMTAKQLNVHYLKGEKATETTPALKPHPFCRFCSEPYFSSDELYAHLVAKHEYCKFCHFEKREFFRTSSALANHYNANHHVCTNGICKDLDAHSMVVFNNVLDLNKHKAEYHNDKTAKRIDLNALQSSSAHTIPRSNVSNNRKNRGRGELSAAGAMNETFDGDTVVFYNDKTDMVLLSSQQQAAIREKYRLSQGLPAIQPISEEVDAMEAIEEEKSRYNLYLDSFPSFGGVDTEAEKQKEREAALESRRQAARWGQDEEFPSLGGRSQEEREEEQLEIAKQLSLQSHVKTVVANPLVNHSTSKNVYADSSNIISRAVNQSKGGWGNLGSSDKEANLEEEYPSFGGGFGGGSASLNTNWGKNSHPPINHGYARGAMTVGGIGGLGASVFIKQKKKKNPSSNANNTTSSSSAIIPPSPAEFTIVGKAKQSQKQPTTSTSTSTSTNIVPPTPQSPIPSSTPVSTPFPSSPPSICIPPQHPGLIEAFLTQITPYLHQHTLSNHLSALIPDITADSPSLLPSEILDLIHSRNLNKKQVKLSWIDRILTLTSLPPSSPSSLSLKLLHRAVKQVNEEEIALDIKYINSAITTYAKGDKGALSTVDSVSTRCVNILCEKFYTLLVSLCCLSPNKKDAKTMYKAIKELYEAAQAKLTKMNNTTSSSTSSSSTSTSTSTSTVTGGDFSSGSWTILPKKTVAKPVKPNKTSKKGKSSQSQDDELEQALEESRLLQQQLEEAETLAKQEHMLSVLSLTSTSPIETSSSSSLSLPSLSVPSLSNTSSLSNSENPLRLPLFRSGLDITTSDFPIFIANNLINPISGQLMPIVENNIMFTVMWMQLISQQLSTVGSSSFFGNDTSMANFAQNTANAGVVSLTEIKALHRALVNSKTTPNQITNLPELPRMFLPKTTTDTISSQFESFRRTSGNSNVNLSSHTTRISQFLASGKIDHRNMIRLYEYFATLLRVVCQEKHLVITQCKAQIEEEGEKLRILPQKKKGKR